MALRWQRDEVTKEPKISGQWSVVGGQSGSLGGICIFVVRDADEMMNGH